METPLFTLGPKEFLSGIAPSAHTERGGLFLSANGVTPIYDPGGTASVENGLLQAGSAPTDFSSGVVDTIFAGDVGYVSSLPYLFMLGNSGHLYQKALGAGAVTDLRSSTPITNARNGLAVFEYSGSTKLFYAQDTAIGIWDMASTYPTGWTDNAFTISAGQHPMHKFLDRLFFGNSNHIAFIQTDGTASSSALDFPSPFICTAIADDGSYLVVAISENSMGSNNFALNKILFWNTNASSWQVEYSIKDPFIWALKRRGSAVYAFGQYGIYEVTFSGGVRKILSRLIGFGTTADLTAGYGASRAHIFNNDAVLFATDTTIDSIGTLSAEVPPSYLKPFKVPSSVGTPSFLHAGFDVGRVYVATDSNKLYGYDFNNATRDTGVSFQTIYIPFKQKAMINRIDVIFGEPLASGDAFDIDTKVDEDTAAVDFGAASYASDGAIRRKSMYPNAGVQVDEQLSLTGNFTGGAAKIKRIEGYGQPMTP